MAKLFKRELVYPELSFKILGCAFKIHNLLGGDLLEKEYQKALKQEFLIQGIAFKEQFYIPMKMNNIVLSKRYCDFIIEDKIVIEIKSRRRLRYSDFKQTEQYLKVCNLKLGLLIVFGKEYVTHKRILNLF